MTEKNTETVEMKKQPNKTDKKKKPKGPYYRQRIVAKVLIVITAIGLIGATGVGVYAMGQMNKAPNLSASDFTSPNSTKILSAQGNEIYDAGVKKRDSVSFNELSTSLIDAFVAAEDSRFFEHSGFDVPRFTRAALNNLGRTLTTGRFDFSEGGSTFTMQLIKNTVFMHDDGTTVTEAEGGSGGIGRKLQEIYLSQKVDADGMLSKQLILELYLNTINFGVGNNIVGIENSAQAYFGKKAADLNIVESAFMAGVINAPFSNSPYTSIENANSATQRVLNNMLYHGYITQAEFDSVKNIKIEDLLVERNTNIGADYPYQAYIDAVMEEAKELTNENPAEVSMIIHTAMDEEVQGAIDKVQRREVSYLDFGADNSLQAGSAIVNNQTGEIIGTFGGYDYNGQLLFNRATDKKLAPKQPGSVLKPVVSYAPAYQYLGWASDHIITDEPFNVGGGFYISNYDNNYEGQIDVNRALSDSRNVPAIKAFLGVREAIGNDAYMKVLRDMGLSIDADTFDWAYAIGNDDFKVTPVQMAGATATLFNDGQYITPHTITKIEFQDGRAPYEVQNQPVQVLAPGAAYLATRSMKHVVDTATPANSFASPLKRSYPVFGKTGTVKWDDEQAANVGVPKSSDKDRLMIAATDKFTIATWVGFDKNDSKSYFSEAERQLNFPGEFNSYILDVLADEYGRGRDISQPDDLVSLTHIKGPFPYQAPLADMDPSLVSSGLILRNFAKLTEATPQELLGLDSQSVTVEASGRNLKFNVTMSPYPDATKLTVAPDTLPMTNPSTGRSYSGKRVFDESWIYGAVRYKTELRINGSPVKEIMSEDNVQTIEYQVPSNATNIELCSYYTFDKSQSRKSNEKCSPVSNDQIPGETAPNFIGQDISVFMDWATANELATPTITYKVSDQPYGTILEMNPKIDGQSFKPDQLSGMKVTVTVADTQVSANLIYSDFTKRYGSYLTITSATQNPSPTALIIGYKFGTNNVQSFLLSERKGQTVEVIFKD